MRRWALAWIVLFVLAGCVDVRSFEGTWAGKIMAEEAIRQGFAADSAVDRLKLSHVDLHDVTATLSTTDGKFQYTPLQRVNKFSNDALSSLTFDGAPLRSYLLFASLAAEPQGELASIVLSVFGDDHLELRVLRGNDLFGVFNLQRIE